MVIKRIHPLDDNLDLSELKEIGPREGVGTSSVPLPSYRDAWLGYGSGHPL